MVRKAPIKLRGSNLSNLYGFFWSLPNQTLAGPVKILLTESDPVISSSNSWKANIAASRADSHLFFPDNKKWRVLYYHHYLLPISVAAAGSRSSCEECAWHERHSIYGENMRFFPYGLRVVLVPFFFSHFLNRSECQVICKRLQFLFSIPSQK